MPCLTFVPTGGLANRMRAIAAAVNLSQRIGVRVEMVWFQGWGMHAPFSALFKPLPNLREARGMDFLLNDKPRWDNLYLPAILRKMVYNHCIKDKEMYYLLRDNFDFEQWAAKGRNWMSSYHCFGKFENYDQLLTELFVPQDDILEDVACFTQQFSEHTIGLHIRRTDNINAIKASPTELFITAVDKELSANAATKIFLATDDEPTKELFAQHYGSALITSHRAASRNSVQGIKDGLTDMLVLSHCAIIYGTAESSFSVMASHLGRIPLTILSTPNL